MPEIRTEKPEEYRQTEELVRKSFMGVYQPLSSEHLILHNLRKSSDYDSNLSRILAEDGKIIGQIAYVRSDIVNKETGERIKAGGFGPICIDPERQKEGLGELLISHTLLLAQEDGYRFIVIYGDLDYYRKFGFIPAKDTGLHITGEKEPLPDYILIKNLSQEDSSSEDSAPASLLKSGQWYFTESSAYKITEEELKLFDADFK